MTTTKSVKKWVSDIVRGVPVVLEATLMEYPKLFVIVDKDPQVHYILYPYEILLKHDQDQMSMLHDTREAAIKALKTTLVERNYQSEAMIAKTNVLLDQLEQLLKKGNV